MVKLIVWFQSNGLLGSIPGEVIALIVRNWMLGIILWTRMRHWLVVRMNLPFLLPEVQWRQPQSNTVRHGLDGGGWFNVNSRRIAWPLTN